MGDVAEKRVGNRTYHVYGLQDRAQSIRSAAQAVSSLSLAQRAMTEVRTTPGFPSRKYRVGVA